MRIERELHTEFMEKARMRMGSELESAMKHRNVSVEELASKVGMLPEVLKKYLSGDESMSIGMFDLLLSLLDYKICVFDIDGKPL